MPSFWKTSEISHRAWYLTRDERYVVIKISNLPQYEFKLHNYMKIYVPNSLKLLHMLYTLIYWNYTLNHLTGTNFALKNRACTKGHINLCMLIVTGYDVCTKVSNSNSYFEETQNFSNLSSLFRPVNLRKVWPIGEIIATFVLDIWGVSYHIPKAWICQKMDITCALFLENCTLWFD